MTASVDSPACQATIGMQENADVCISCFKNWFNKVLHILGAGLGWYQ